MLRSLLTMLPIIHWAIRVANGIVQAMVHCLCLMFQIHINPHMEHLPLNMVPKLVWFIHYLMDNMLQQPMHLALQYMVQVWNAKGPILTLVSLSLFTVPKKQSDCALWSYTLDYKIGNHICIQRTL